MVDDDNGTFDVFKLILTKKWMMLTFLLCVLLVVLVVFPTPLTMVIVLVIVVILFAMVTKNVEIVNGGEIGGKF